MLIYICFLTIIKYIVIRNFAAEICALFTLSRLLNFFYYVAGECFACYDRAIILVRTIRLLASHTVSFFHFVPVRIIVLISVDGMHASRLFYTVSQKRRARR